MKRIYLVTDGLQWRLVRASNRAQARNHVARDTLKVDLATQDDFVTLIQNGSAVEDAVPEQEPSTDE